MTDDVKGYYADLGVSASASVEEIRAVYRALAKIYHPDLNKDQAAIEKFRRITAAYEILSDPAKRRIYDGEQSAQATQQPNTKTPGRADPIVPVQCSVCKKATAQPRFLIFKRVISVVLITHVRPQGGIFCSGCATRTALRASAISAAFGWWGVPWGPIYTVGAILRNAFGGESRPDVDEELRWHNALAFFSQGKFDISASIAAGLQSAKNQKIATNSRHLLKHLAESGIRPGRLRSPWTINPASTVVQIGLTAIIPGLIVLLLSGAGGSANLYVPSYDPSPIGKTTYTGRTPSIAQTGLQDLCAVHPSNGAILSGRLPYVEYGHKLTIRNGSTGDAIVKVRNARTGKTVISFFNGKGQTAILNQIPDGQYRVQFAYGDAMTVDCRKFRNPSASEFPEAQWLATQITDTQVITQELSFTLYSVPGGNVRPSRISASQFEAD